LAKDDPQRVWDVVLYVRAHATARLVAVLSHQLRPHGISAAVFYPGWTRTEDMVAATLAGEYPLALLAVDPRLPERSGGTITARGLALEFTDIDGRIPELRRQTPP
jgi:NAD(P)-dependent dehydrogenase (short-subunit alcohol dehydrogenase family)